MAPKSAMKVMTPKAAMKVMTPKAAMKVMKQEKADKQSARKKSKADADFEPAVTPSSSRAKAAGTASLLSLVHLYLLYIYSLCLIPFHPFMHKCLTNPNRIPPAVIPNMIFL
jgi:hypothetical protein